MTRLFIRFYVGILSILFVAWYVHGLGSDAYYAAERFRVAEGAHGGGVRLMANELDAVPTEEREAVLDALRKEFDYPIEIVNLLELQNAQRQRIIEGDDVVFYTVENYGFVVVPLAGSEEVVQFGPFPRYTHIEESLGGGVRLAARKLDQAPPDDREALLETLQTRFDYPVEIALLDDLPNRERKRITAGDDVVFYEANERAFVVTPLSSGQHVVRFGPFPNYDRVEQRAIATTLAVVLLLAAIAIAFLLRPVARQLGMVEQAAKGIASGDLSARVDERRVNSAKTLAQAFNNMANRTETLVRTQRELLQSVSHELRTPLSRIRFAIDLIETAKDDAERKGRLEAVDAATQELDDLVDELLSYVRLETADLPLSRDAIALDDVLDGLVSKHKALSPQIKFELDANLTGNTNVVYADAAGLQRVLGNLLSNAGRFAKSRVRINAVTRDGTVTIDVDDDGVGIPAPERRRVLEPFVRLEENANGHGFGLGLALVQRIVNRHGGEVAINTSPLGGCRVRTTWPRARDAP